MNIIVYTNSGKKRIFTNQPESLENTLMESIASGQGVSLLNERKVRVIYGPGQISHAVFQRLITSTRSEQV